MSSLTDLVKKLELFASCESHEELFEASFDILKSHPHDDKALKYTIVSLINLDKYQQAYKILKEYPQDPNNLLLEMMYVLHKLNLDKELKTVFDSLSQDQITRGVLHLKAQYFYRIGQYQESLEIYQNLIKESAEEDYETLELSVNERAVLSDAYQVKVFNKTSNQLPLTPTINDSYDLIFNESLINLGLNNYTNALELLNIAEKKSKESNIDPEDQFNETLPIIIQKAYVYQLIGDSKKAQEILQSLDITKTDDALNKLILNNNLISILLSSELSSAQSHLTLKELSLPNILNELSPRLSMIQKLKLFKNYFKLALKIGRKTKAIDEFTINKTSAALASFHKANILADQDEPAIQAKKAFKYAIANKTIESAFVAAQLNVNIGKVDTAILILESLDVDARNTPGAFSLLLALYDKVNSQKKKAALFLNIYEHYIKDCEFKTIDEFEFVKIISLKFFDQFTEKSRELLLKLNNYHKDDLISIVLGESNTDSLKSIDELTGSLNFDDVLKEGLQTLSKEQTIKTSGFKVQKKKKVKKPKVTVNYDEFKQPDPERWLPLKDRSYYKPKKGKKKNIRETQGGLADNSTEEFLTSKVKKQSFPSKKSKKKGRK